VDHAAPLIGRADEVRKVIRYLLQPDVRLLTLTGPGGIGKSRLVEAAADAIAGAFADGAHVVDLASVGDPTFVLPAIAQVLGQHESAAAPALEHLSMLLHDLRLLLVLDNFEQVLDAAALIAALVAACPTLKVLVASRSPLRVECEREFAIPPLELPDPSAAPAIDTLAAVPSVALFINRAQAVLPEWRLTHSNAAVISQLCLRLDGLPLAIELAAGRMKILSEHDILRRVVDRLDVLAGSARDRPDRHRSLRAAMDWSHDLLSGQGQVLFRRLAVFAGGWTLAAAEIVCACDGIAEDDVLDLLAELVDGSLVSVDPSGGGARRYRLLETIRQYAVEKLDLSGEAGILRQRHATYFQSIALQVDVALSKTGTPDNRSAIAEVGPERDNLRQALQWSVDQAQAEHAARLGGVLWQVLEQAVVRHPQPTKAIGTSALTARELEVAALVARGFSNQAVADELVIGRRTAETHVERILNKLGFDSRTQIGVWAAERGLLNAPAD